MIRFILNNEAISTSFPTGMTLLDFVRYEKRLVGTKIGCREGDCGACTVLMGELIDGKMRYKSLTSCLTPLGNASGKHVVTIEGLNMEQLTPYQQAMVDESGTQCGFCTVGFIVSFAGECLSSVESSYKSVISAIDGNICRCTGYKSIERASRIIHQKLKEKELDDPIPWLIENKFIPAYFETIPARLIQIKANSVGKGKQIVGGGTDLYVQRPDEMFETKLELVSDNTDLIGISETEDYIQIKSASNTTAMMESSIMQSAMPKIREYLKLVSSTPIRNIATLAGNLVNASPIGDLSILFLALNSQIEMADQKGNSREIALKDFFLDYKTLNKQPEEFVRQLRFKKPEADSYFNFEKISKRTYLDIASVNSAMSLRWDGHMILEAHVSAGGVAPVPKYLEKTSRFLEGKELSEDTVLEAMQLMNEEIAPISDVRGSKEYKRLLLRQLFYAHFMECFPEIFKMDVFV